MIMIAMLLIAIIGGHYMHKKGSKYIQEAALTTVIGIYIYITIYIYSLTRNGWSRDISNLRK